MKKRNIATALNEFVWGDGHNIMKDLQISIQIVQSIPSKPQANILPLKRGMPKWLTIEPCFALFNPVVIYYEAAKCEISKNVLRCVIIPTPMSI